MTIIVKQFTDEEALALVKATLTDLMKKFFYYDRKSDEELTFDVLEEILDRNLCSPHEMKTIILQAFDKELERFLLNQ